MPFTVSQSEIERVAAEKGRALAVRTFQPGAISVTLIAKTERAAFRQYQQIGFF